MYTYNLFKLPHSSAHEVLKLDILTTLNTHCLGEIWLTKEPSKWDICLLFGVWTLLYLGYYIYILVVYIKFLQFYNSINFLKDILHDLEDKIWGACEVLSELCVTAQPCKDPNASAPWACQSLLQARAQRKSIFLPGPTANVDTICRKFPV